MESQHDLRLPDGSNLLHIGPQKTGSTALQASLHAAREELRQHGVVYPGPGRKPVRAVAAGLGVGLRRSAFTPHARAWLDLVRQVQAGAAHRVCLSHEGFGRFDGEQAARVVEALGGERPHVLAAARRLDVLMPSQWQQRIKSGKRYGYHDWLELVLTPGADTRAAHHLWSGHDTVALVERWAEVVGVEHVTVVAIDPADHRHLLSTVERLLGVPPGLLPSVEDHANRSLSFEETELVRAVNLAHTCLPTARDEDWRELVSEGAVASLLASRPVTSSAATPFPALPAWARRRLHELGEERLDGLARLGVRVVGDLHWLQTPPLASPDDGNDDGDDDEATAAATATHVPVEAVVAAFTGVLARAGARRRPTPAAD